MSHPHITPLLNHQKVFEIGNKLLEFFALNIKSIVYKGRDDSETVSHFLKLLRKNSLVLDIGLHADDYLFFIQQMAKRSGRLLAFEGQDDTYNYLLSKK